MTKDNVENELKDLLSKSLHPSYETKDEILIEGDTVQVMNKIKEGSVNMIFADPPYFLSNGGITCHSGTMQSVDKGDWDKADSVTEKHQFNRKWIRKCKKLLAPGGTIWISGTMHNIYSIGMALEQEGFVILNNITWQKTNPPPNLACRCFTHSTETILWACRAEEKPKHIFNYEYMKQENGGKQMQDVWTGNLTPPEEKKWGKHPTQKPLYLLLRIIQASTNPGDIILDPFCGSSTTGVAAKQLGRKYIGIDKESEFIELSKARLKAEYSLPLI